jgi:hypothetical protein
MLFRDLPEATQMPFFDCSPDGATTEAIDLATEIRRHETDLGNTDDE